MNDQTETKTDFGYQKVSPQEKTAKVTAVFNSVANKYDLMNDLMSLGIHRLWKKAAIAQCKIKKGDVVLDLATGTCDLAQVFTTLVGETGFVVASDINNAMLSEGRDKLINNNIIKNVTFLTANAECIPLQSNVLDCVSIAFGLRNITNKESALKEIYRVLKPGGRLVILEFSKPSGTIFKNMYDLYSFKILPKLGELITNDSSSYQYLVESIRMHPDQETLVQIILNAGFDECNYKNLTNGVATIHTAYKY